MYYAAVFFVEQTMSGILNLIASIWESILPALEKTVNEPSLDLIQQTVTGDKRTIMLLCALIESTAVR